MLILCYFIITLCTILPDNDFTISIINKFRAENNAGPLKVNKSLSEIALDRAIASAKKKSVVYNFADGKTLEAKVEESGYGKPSKADVFCFYFFANNKPLVIDNIIKYGKKKKTIKG
ncbi:hypothetical protein EDEG_01238 [Edhazardia aedis USNM 41457]|uniref:SCP domain-containing protein n=1 Tax=Edhazardia aedis (strain USNM 41457) TaxID=1003232 RepID=J9DPT8_EDHAE|nr:hypothetical protein EDEG_01238 [Edhazardia aedis USNM 41457]|eukprot:EJW04555.1 hypothetical protein EDEG_01238 [Edhazardia aedis USNM 41457]